MSDEPSRPRHRDPVVDAHLHVWDPANADYAWLTGWGASNPDAAALDRVVELAEARPALAEAGVDAVVLVQSLDDDADTDHLFRVAAARPEVVGVVAYAALERADEVERRVAELRAAHGDLLVGVRTLIHDLPDPDHVLRADVAAGLDALAAAGLPFDYVTADPRALRHLPELARRHPSLVVVLDHLGKPPIGLGDGARAEWRELLAAAAESPRLVAKVSGIASAAGEIGAWTVDDVRPFVADALDVLGPDRLLFGGDWPVSTLAGGYAKAADAIIQLVEELAPDARARILGGNAARVYALDPARLERAQTRGRA